MFTKIKYFFIKILHFFGLSNSLNRIKIHVQASSQLEEQLSKYSDQKLLIKFNQLKSKFSNGSINIFDSDEIIITCALIREVIKRIIHLRIHDVQLVGAIILAQGKIIEMKTGEGKTLVAATSACFSVLLNKQTYIVTVNDYLASRDSEWMGKILQFLQISVGCIISTTPIDKRIAEYRKNVVYATNNELGFDYLRDNMRQIDQPKIQSDLNWVYIDEVDSILIDEARTPLIISGPTEDRTNLYKTITTIINHINQEDCIIDYKSKSAYLNEEGNNKVEEKLYQYGVIAKNSTLYDIQNLHYTHIIQQCLLAKVIYHKDKDYIIRKGNAYIIDEFTGRVLEGRRYSGGLHQAIEAKEQLKIQGHNQTLASITFPNFFRMYDQISGMTGTAIGEQKEFGQIYGLEVTVIPTNKPIIRVDHDDLIYRTKEEKYNAILQKITEKYEKGQPILVGTRSIEQSELLSNKLTQHKILHSVLNAKYHEKEAQIIAQAGAYKAITIATNMAGRGTDIKLGGAPEFLAQQQKIQLDTPEYENMSKQVSEEEEKIKKLGGLCVIGTERNESRRIDNQLRGRSGRQGDPGESYFFLSLEDDLMKVMIGSSNFMSNILNKLSDKDGEPIHHTLVSKAIANAQSRIEEHNREIRANLLKYDNIVNEQRNIIYQQREDIIQASDLSKYIKDVIREWIDLRITEFTNNEDTKIDIILLKNTIEKQLNITLIDLHDTESTIDLRKKIFNTLNNIYEERFAIHPKKIVLKVQQIILLKIIDHLWLSHLKDLDNLNNEVTLRSYGQKDPLIEYQKESFSIFEKMINQQRHMIMRQTFHLQLASENRFQGKKSLKHPNEE